MLWHDQMQNHDIGQ